MGLNDIARKFIVCFWLLLSICVAGVQASTEISGNIVTSSWTVSGSPYIITAYSNIAEGSMLTIEPGVVIKFNAGVELDVRGSMIAGAVGAPAVVFTSIKDDGEGGDTNGDGAATSPAVGDWNVLIFYALDGSNSVLENCTIKYSSYPGLLVSAYGSGAVRFSHGRISNCNGGVRVEGTVTGMVDISSNSIVDNSGYGVRVCGADRAHVQCRLVNNEISRNADSGIYLEMCSAYIEGNSISSTTGAGYGIYCYSASPEVRNNIVRYNNNFALYQFRDSYPIYSGNELAANAYNAVGLNRDGALYGGTLSYIDDQTAYVVDGVQAAYSGALNIEPGVIIKSNSNLGVWFWNSGQNMCVAGTADRPVIFTSIKDDSVGGDTNGDGSVSVPAPGDWYGVTVYASPGSDVLLDHCIVRYAGTAISINSVEGSTVDLHHSSITFCSYTGISLEAGETCGSVDISSNTVNHSVGYGAIVRGSAVTEFNTYIALNDIFNTNARGIVCDGASPVLDGNVIINALGEGYGLSCANASPVICNITVQGSDNYPIALFGDSSPRYSGNININNNRYEGILVAGPQNVTWRLCGDIPYVTYFRSVNSLAIEPGVVVKISRYYNIVANSITAIGTLEKPIIFTSISDDTVGGDTVHDGGAETPQQGDWENISVGYNSEFEHCSFKYGGNSYASLIAIMTEGAGFSMINSTIAYSASIGLAIGGSPSYVLVSSSTFSNSSVGITFNVNDPGETCCHVRYNNLLDNINGGVFLSNGNPEICGNRFQSTGGVGLYCENVSPIIWDNSFSGFSNAIQVYSGTLESPTPIMHHNNIFDNSVGVAIMGVSALVNAEGNWWGSASGPYNSVCNPAGTGNAVADMVDFLPFLPEDISHPCAPRAVSIAPGNNELALTWMLNDQVNIAGYNVYRSLTSGNSYSKCNSSIITGNEYADTGLTNGTVYYYVVTAQDSNNDESVYSNEVTDHPRVDLTPPSAPSVSNFVMFVSSPVYMLEGTKDADSSVLLNGIESIAVSTETSWALSVTLQDGANSFSISSKDQDGNESLTTTGTITLDTQAPTVKGRYPVNGSYISFAPFVVVIAFEDNLSGVNAVGSVETALLMKSPGMVVNGNWNTSVFDRVIFTPSEQLSDGAYTLTLNLTDRAGNVLEVSNGFTIDTLPPAAPVISFSSQSVINPAYILTGTKEAETGVWLNDVECIPANSDTTWSVPVTLQSGDNTFLVHVKDRAGNQSSDISVMINYDDQVPLVVENVTITAEGNGTTLGLSWVGYNEGLYGNTSHYNVYAQTTEFSDVLGMTPVVAVAHGTFAANITGLARGTTYYCAVVAVSDSDRMNSAVTTQAACPRDVVAPQSVGNLHSQSLEYSLICTWAAPSDTDVAGYKIYFNGSSDPMTLSSTQTTYEVTGLDIQTIYTVKVAAFDVDNNENAGVVIDAMTLFSSNPAVIAEPQDGYVDLGWDTAGFNWTGSLWTNIYISTQPFVSVAGMLPVQRQPSSFKGFSVTGLKNHTTYYAAVAMENISGDQRNDVVATPVCPIEDTVGPEILDVRNANTGESLFDGMILHRNFDISFRGVDPSGVSHGKLFLDGRCVNDYLPYHDPCAGSVYAAGSATFGAAVNLYAVTDGEHVLKIVTYDTKGNESSIEYHITVLLYAPAKPYIVQPRDGTYVTSQMIEVSGWSEAYVSVYFYINNSTCACVPGSSSELVVGRTLLQEGVNHLKISAVNRAGETFSDEYSVTLDTTRPKPPAGLAASPRSGGVIRLSWGTPSGDEVMNYKVYRATWAFSDAASGLMMETSSMQYEDLTPEDATWYYRVSAVNKAGAEGELTSLAMSISDRVPPQASSVVYEPLGSYDPVDGRIGAGAVRVTLHVTQQLQALPFLSIVPYNGIPITVELTKISGSLADAGEVYSGIFLISDTTPSGTASVVFSGRDKADNRGTDILSGSTFEIDTKAPQVQRITLSPENPIQNDNASPVNVTVTIGLDDTICASTAAWQTDPLPVGLSYRVGASTGVEIANLTQVTPAEGEQQAWQGSFTLAADAGLNGAETLQFTYRGRDDLDNESTVISCANLFEVYQGSLPALGAPQGLTVKTLAAGKVRVSWLEVGAAADYVIYRKGPGEQALSLYAYANNLTGEQTAAGLGVTATQIAGSTQRTIVFTDAPPADGTYTYAISSLRRLNNQETESEKSSFIEVVSDATTPLAPQNFGLELGASGIRCEWTPPAGSGYTESVTYSVYRSSGNEITDISGLSPLRANIAGTVYVDNDPSASKHCYAVTAKDAAGNESGPSNSYYLNFALLPVSNIAVKQIDASAPELNWTHSSTGAISGYNVYLVKGTQQVKLNSGLLATTTFQDGGYTGGARTYALTAVDSNAIESVARQITLPDITIAESKTGQSLKRGLMNRLEYVVKNNAAVSITNAAVTVNIFNHTHMSDVFTIEAGATRTVSVVVPGYAGLTDPAGVQVSATMTTSDGERISRGYSGTIGVGTGMLVVGIKNEALVRGSTGQVWFTLENPSEEDVQVVSALTSGTMPSDEVWINLLDKDGNVLSKTAYKQGSGEGIVTLTNRKSVARISGGATFTSAPVEIAVPLKAPNEVRLQVSISALHHDLGEMNEVVMAGFTSERQVTLIDTSYYAELSTITPAVSWGNIPVKISGRAIDRNTSVNTQGVSGASLKIVVTHKGFERVYEVVTDSAGVFTYSFMPYSTESGKYEVCVVHPDVSDRYVQGTFNIKRCSVTPVTINMDIARNYAQDATVEVRTGEESRLDNVRLVYNAGDQANGEYAKGIHISTTPAVEVLSTNWSTSLKFTVWGDNTAAGAAQAVLKVRAFADGQDREFGTITVNMKLNEAKPAVSFSPGSVETGVKQGGEESSTVIVENSGYAQMSDVTVSLVNYDNTAAPGWMTMSVSSAIGNMEGRLGSAAGDSKTITVMFSPGNEVTEGIYTAYLKVEAQGQVMGYWRMTVNVTNAGIGNALFKVIDIYTGTVGADNQQIQGVGNAMVRVENEAVSSVTRTVYTDSAGEAQLNDLPEGIYKYWVSANNHQEQIGRIWIKPGITQAQQVFLTYNLVTVEWSVQPTTIEDRYEIVLTATYATDVPAAVVVAEPRSITLPEMRAGDVYTFQIKYTNYGLIAAEKITHTPFKNDEFFNYEYLYTVPETLGAKESVVIPIRITCVNGIEEAGGSGGGTSYGQCEQYWYISKCANGTITEGTVNSCVNRTEITAEEAVGYVGGGAVVIDGGVPGGTNNTTTGIAAGSNACVVRSCKIGSDDFECCKQRARQELGIGE